MRTIDPKIDLEDSDFINERLQLIIDHTYRVEIEDWERAGQKA